MNTTSMVQNLLAALPIVAALLLLRAGNVPKVRRHQQFVLPVVAVLYAIFALIVLYRFNEWFDSLLAWVFGLVPFLEQFYQTQWLYLIENSVIVAAFVVVKLAYRTIAKALFTGDRFIGSELVEHFYEYDVASGRWFVRPSFSQVRVLYQSLFWVSIAVTVLLIFAMRQMPDWPGFMAISFPAIAVLVLGEVWYALDGMTRAEAHDLIEGERDRSRRIVNYAALRQVFRDLFGSRVIDEGVDLAGPYALTSHQAIDELSKSPDATEQLYAEYFDRIKQEGVDVDENLMHASLGLLGGNSTLINTPFSADLTHYLALPAYVKLLRGGRCLIIAGRDSSAHDAVKWITDGLETITGVPDLWNVQVLGEAAVDGLDVGILRSADLHHLQLLAAHDRFFQNVAMVVIMEPSRMMAAGQLGLSAVVSRLSLGEVPVYAAFDRNHDGLVDGLSHLLKVNLTDVVATRQALGASSEIVWNADGPNLASMIFPGVARYLGVGTEIAAVALKYHVSEVTWVGGDTFPVADMSWIAGQYFGSITSFAEMEGSQRALSTSLVAHANPVSLERRDRGFLVVEDEISNVYESLRLFASRSTESGFVNLISENYLMRDYMVDNRHLFAADPKAIPAIVPDFARTRRNTVLKLLMLLSAFEVPESTLLRELELVGCVPEPAQEETGLVQDEPVIVLLKQLIERYLGMSGVPIVSAHRSLAGLGTEQRPTAYRLAPGTDIERVSKELGSAYFLIEDEQEGRDYIGACLRGHVAQTALPGQFLTVGGKYYEVLTSGSDEHHEEVVLRRAAEHITGRPQYRALRMFHVEHVAVPEGTTTSVQGERVRVDLVTATVTARTHGYLELPNRSDFSQMRRVSVEGLPARTYIEKDVLRISMPDATPDERRTIALLLNELFVTLFPSAHPFLVALTSDPDRALADLLPEFVADDEQAIFIVEDSFVDMGLIVAVQRHWRRLFETITDYLAWLHSPRAVAETEVHGPVIFEGESEEEAAARQRRIDEASERGSYEVPQQPSWIERAWRRVKSWFKRKPKADVEPEAVAEQPVELDAVFEQSVETEVPAEPDVVAEPEFEFFSEPEFVAEPEAVLEQEPVPKAEAPLEPEGVLEPEAAPSAAADPPVEKVVPAEPDEKPDVASEQPVDEPLLLEPAEKEQQDDKE